MRILLCAALAIALGATGCPSPRAAASEQASVLPIYPGAKKLVLPSGSDFSVTGCGVTMRLVDYKVSGSSVATIAQWYADRMPGGIRVTTRPQANMFAEAVYAADGSSVATVIQTAPNPDLAKFAKPSHIAGGVTLGLVTYQPNLPPDILKLVIQSSRHGDDAKAAHDRLKAKCPDLAGTP